MDEPFFRRVIRRAAVRRAAWREPKDHLEMGTLCSPELVRETDPFVK
jgi:hypothetical protein